MSIFQPYESYNLAILPYEIQFTETAAEDLNALKASDRAKVEDAIEKFLHHEPDKISKSRIKRLRNMISPQYRLRVDDKGVLRCLLESEHQEWHGDCSRN
jgi:mRNA-degrading endonuclease RelE of RelBE toxin-antitoxin system